MSVRFKKAFVCYNTSKNELNKTLADIYGVPLADVNGVWGYRAFVTVSMGMQLSCCWSMWNGVLVCGICLKKMVQFIYHLQRHLWHHLWHKWASTTVIRQKNIWNYLLLPWTRQQCGQKELWHLSCFLLWERLTWLNWHFSFLIRNKSFSKKFGVWRWWFTFKRIVFVPNCVRNVCAAAYMHV